MKSEHLSKEKVEGYVFDLLKPSEAYEIGRHLIDCADCRKFLPELTLEQFREYILGIKKGDKLPPSSNDDFTKPNFIHSIVPIYFVFSTKRFLTLLFSR